MKRKSNNKSSIPSRFQQSKKIVKKNQWGSSNSHNNNIKRRSIAISIKTNSRRKPTKNENSSKLSRSLSTTSDLSTTSIMEGRRISNRMRKPSCRLNFGHFELSSKTFNKSEVKATATKEDNPESLSTKINLRNKRLVGSSEDQKVLTPTGQRSASYVNKYSNSSRKSTNLRTVSSFIDEEPNCYCLKDENVFAAGGQDEEEDKLHYCQATDLLEETRIGCTRLCPDLQLYRVSAQSVFKRLCSNHRTRLRLHLCCPLCDLFCAQGQGILLCRNSEHFHLFHKNCAELTTDETSNQIICPHCGGNYFEEIQLEIRGNRNPVFFTGQKPNVLRELQQMPKLVEIPSIKTSILEHLSDSSKIADAVEKAGNISALENKSLRKCLKDSDLLNFMALLMAGRDPNERYSDASGQSILHFAVQSDNLSFIHALITSAADPNLTDDFGNTPLMIGSTANVLKYLLAAGADPSLKNKTGKTAIHIISKSGSLELIQSLSIETNLQLLESKDKNGLTPVMIGAKYGHANIVGYLTSMCLSISAVDKHGNNVVHWAAFGGSVEAYRIVYALWKGQPDIIRNDEGDTPLHIAVKQKNVDCALGILLSGFDPSVKNSNGKSAIDLCDEEESDLQSLKAIFNQTLILRNRFGMDKRQLTRVISSDISNGRENLPIRCMNIQDEEILENFTYITTPIISNRQIQPDLSYQSVHHCSCNDTLCTSDCNCSSSNQLRYINGKLNLPYGELKIPFEKCQISECNQLCSCNISKCSNRLVQKGLQFQLEVFRKIDQNCAKNACKICNKNTKKWGVRALERIPRGSFVCEFMGEFSSSYSREIDFPSSYILELYRSGNVECNSVTFLMNSIKFGNVSRFLNQSCQPSLFPLKVFVEHSDKRFPRICFFSNTDIYSGQELTI